MRWIVLIFGLILALPALGASDPFAIYKDEIYRRDGALPTISTCLAVADDPHAVTLLQRVLGDESIADHALADELQAVGSRSKRTDGYGTLLTCARIVEAWYAVSITQGGKFLSMPEDHSDGRQQHGTVVVDLAISEDENAEIAPVPLVRIITSRSLLPNAVFGGIVFKNAIIKDALVFHNTHLAIPLAFAKVKFWGGTYQKKVFGIDEPVRDTALTIIHSRFDDHILIADSDFCGHIRILDSALRETLAFENVRQHSIVSGNCRGKSDEKGHRPVTRIDGNRFEQGVSFIRVRLGKLRMEGNDIDSLISSRSDFGAEFSAWSNDIGLMQFNCSVLADAFDLSYNHIEKDAFIFGSKHVKFSLPNGDSCADWWEVRPDRQRSRRTDIVIASNQIGGGLGLQGLDPAALQSPVDLSSNRVGNGSEIGLPAADTEPDFWGGVFKLNGSTYDGTLEIFTDLAGKFLGEDLEAYWNSLPVIREEYCKKITSEPNATISDPSATIDFMAARIHVLKWNLPLECAYRWSGYGLSYDLWLAGETPKNQPGSIEGSDHQDYLKAWRQMLVSAEAAPLNAMSDYLTDNGSSVDGREILREAKRLNYARNCPPDLWTLACFLPDLTWLRPHGQASAASTDAAEVSTPTESRSWDERLASTLKLALLWPGGFGAAPEEALLWLFVCTLICWLIYAGYALWLKYRLEHVPLERSRLRRIRSTLIIPIASVNLPPGRTGEPKIEDAIASIDDLCDRWPIETSWPYIKRDERLEKLSKILVPGLLRCEELLAGSALSEIRAIRRKLELFGNTEKLGFSLFDGNKMPVRFTYGRYAIDTMLPFIDLHAYNNYYPEHLLIRVLSVLQHVCGWWWLTVFIASAAIL